MCGEAMSWHIRDALLEQAPLFLPSSVKISFMLRVKASFPESQRF